jgi:hypothetical protein
MRMRFVRRGGAIGAVVAASLVIGAMPASAAPCDGSAYAAKVAVTLLGAAGAKVGPLAVSNTSGPTTKSVANISVPGVVSTGVATTSATLNQETGVVHAQAQIAGATLAPALVSGQIGLVTAVCDATQAGITGATTLANVSIPGVSVSANPAPNTTVKLLNVKIVFNEQLTGSDGSRTVNAVHIYLNPLAGRGDVVLSHARCGPATPPVPLASGLGLWIGLGLLGIAAVPAALIVRKRRLS